MFVRETRRRNADGTVVAYLQLAASFRDRQGRPRTRVLLNLGRADRVDRDALAAVVASLGGRSGPVRAAQGGRAVVVRSREAGGAWLLDELWRTAGLRATLLSTARTRSRATKKLERTAFSLVAHHALSAGGKRATARWLAEDVAVHGCDRLTRSVMYDALDLLLTTRHDTIKAMAAHATSIAAHDAKIDEPRLLDVVLLDVAADGGLRGKAPGRRGRDTVLPQTMAVIAVNSCGLPIYCRLHNADVTVGAALDEIRLFFANWPIRHLIRFAYDGTDLRCRWAAEIIDPGASALLGRIRGTRVGELRPGSMRESLRLESARTPTRPARHPGGGEDVTVWRYLDLAGLDGSGSGSAGAAPRTPPMVTYLVQAPAGLGASGVATRCAALLRRVRGWQRVMAGMRLGPVWHYRQDRVDAHAHLVLLAAFLLCVAEETAAEHWPRILETMTGLRVRTLRTPTGHIDLRTTITTDQRTMLRALNLSLPPEVYGLRLNAM